MAWSTAANETKHQWAGRRIRAGSGSGGGPNGDLYLSIKVAPHPEFYWKGNDLHCDLPVELYTAILGGKAQIKTPKGNVTVDIPGGTQDGKELRLRGLGMPVYTKKNEFKKAFRFFCERVFGIVKSNWVLFRIINSSTQKTLSEHFETRMGFSGTCPHISNKMIIEAQHIESLTIVISNPQNLNILVGCILPVENVSSHERIFIQAITNELTMLYVILNSSYYRKENNVLRENQHN